MTQNLNIEFFNEYKRLDKLCSEIYDQNSGGVTSYINDMESISILGVSNIPGWDATYNKLKSLRHTRNQMAHGEGSFEDYECDYDDIKWLRDFYEKIMNVSDPLAIYRRNTQVKKQVQNNKQINNLDRSKRDEATRTIKDERLYVSSYKSNSRPSLLGIIVFSFILIIIVMIIVCFFLEYVNNLYL